MPLHRRVPKRGFTNIFRQEFNVLTVENLERAFEAGTAVNEAALKSAGFKLKTGLPVKILGTGDLKKALTVSAHNFTAGARKKIEAAGGRCEEVQA
jgi:large subunit ribosomal protein L15